MNLQNKISTIKDAKDNIKQALIDKGVIPSGNITTYADAINSITIVNNQSKTVTQNGTVRPDTGYTGLDAVTVNVPLESLTINPSTTSQSITHNNHGGYNSITVNPVTSSIDSDIQANNIKLGCNILGVNGNVVELNGETRTINPSTSQQVITPTSGKNGITQVTVNAVTSSIDANIIASNIKKNVTILSVTGSYEGSGSISVDWDAFMTSHNDILGDYNYVIKTDGTIEQFKSSNGQVVLPISETTINSESFLQIYKNRTNISAVSLAAITTIGDINVLAPIFWQAFSGSSNLEYINFDNLKTLRGKDLFNHCFDGTKIRNLRFKALDELYTMIIEGIQYFDVTVFGALGGMFENIYFDALKSTSFKSGQNVTKYFNEMLTNISNCTVHFPSNLQSVIGSWSDVTAGFGGTNTTVLFDLPATT